MFMNVQDMCQIICRNVQALKWHINFQNISRFVTAIYSESFKLTETPNIIIIMVSNKSKLFLHTLLYNIAVNIVYM